MWWFSMLKLLKRLFIKLFANESKAPVRYIKNHNNHQLKKSRMKKTFGTGSLSGGDRYRIKSNGGGVMKKTIGCNGGGSSSGGDKV